MTEMTDLSDHWMNSEADDTATILAQIPEQCRYGFNAWRIDYVRAAIGKLCSLFAGQPVAPYETWRNDTDIFVQLDLESGNRKLSNRRLIAARWIYSYAIHVANTCRPPGFSGAHPSDFGIEGIALQAMVLRMISLLSNQAVCYSQANGDHPSVGHSQVALQYCLRNLNEFATITRSTTFDSVSGRCKFDSVKHLGHVYGIGPNGYQSGFTSRDLLMPVSANVNAHYRLADCYFKLFENHMLAIISGYGQSDFCISAMPKHPTVMVYVTCIMATLYLPIPEFSHESGLSYFSQSAGEIAYRIATEGRADLLPILSDCLRDSGLSHPILDVIKTIWWNNQPIRGDQPGVIGAADAAMCHIWLVSQCLLYREILGHVKQ